MPSPTLRAEAHDAAGHARRLNLLMFGRLLFALLGGAAILIIHAGFEKLPFKPWPVYTVLTFAAFMNLVFLVVARARSAYGIGPGFADQTWTQLLIDVLTVTALVYLTGIGQIFTYLYFAIVISAAVTISGRGALLFASMSTILLAMVSFLFGAAESGAQLPFIEEDRALEIALSAQVRFLLPYLFSFGLSLHLVAALAGYLVDTARRLRILHEEVLENLTDGVVAVDRTGAVGFVNDAAREYLGLKGVARGRRYDEILPADVRGLVEEVLTDRADRRGRFTLDARPVEVSVTRLRSDRRGEVRGVLVMIADISLRDQLVRVSAQAERSGALVEMSAAMAHEIRNPLASIRSAATELASMPTATDDDRTLLDVLVRESGRLNKIISDFLEYASDRRLDVALCDVSAVVQEVGVLLSARDEARNGVAVTVDAPGGMVARADADRLKQVLLNLGINAIEAVGETGAVHVSVSRAEEGIAVEVTDTGPGVPAEHLAKIYDPFYTTKPRGTGMGLAIARRIVRKHDGELVVENRPGGGARARVWLPA